MGLLLLRTTDDCFDTGPEVDHAERIAHERSWWRLTDTVVLLAASCFRDVDLGRAHPVPARPRERGGRAWELLSREEQGLHARPPRALLEPRHRDQANESASTTIVLPAATVSTETFEVTSAPIT